MPAFVQSHILLYNQSNLREHYAYLTIATSIIIKDLFNGLLIPSCSVELSFIARGKVHFLSQVEIDFHSVQAMDPGKGNAWAA